MKVREIIRNIISELPKEIRYKVWNLLYYSIDWSLSKEEILDKLRLMVKDC